MVMKVKNGNLPHSLTWMSYHQQLWPGLCYGLGTLMNSSVAAEDCLPGMEVHLLPLLGINRNITKEWHTLSYAFGGVGLLSLSTEQLISRINLFLQHDGASTIIGKKLQCSLHYLQLQLGTNAHPFLLDFAKWGFLAPTSWVTALWKSLSKHKEIHIHTNSLMIPFPWQNNTLLMSIFRKYTTCQEALAHLNWCRCYLNVLFLSNIMLADGTTVDPSLTGLTQIPHKSSYKFPLDCPTKTDWVEWVAAWRSVLRRNDLLSSPLGAIVHDSHILSNYRYYY